LPPGAKSSEIIFTLSAETETEVKEWIDKVKKAGGTVFNEAGRDETNHYGFVFSDPDGHKFNVLLMEKGM
jgi:predicted lactoylglutathione lyase